MPGNVRGDGRAVVGYFYQYGFGFVAVGAYVDVFSVVAAFVSAVVSAFVPVAAGAPVSKACMAFSVSL